MRRTNNADEEYGIENDVLFSIYLIFLLFVVSFQQNCL